MPNTVQLHRVIRTTPDKLYRAFLDPNALVKWLPPHGFTCSVQEADVREGGRIHMTFHNFSTGHAHGFEWRYTKLRPNEQLEYSSVFDGKMLPGEMRNVITLKKVSVGTEIHVTQEGIPDMIPAEACYLGWQESLTLLTQLVEPNIP